MLFSSLTDTLGVTLRAAFAAGAALVLVLLAIPRLAQLAHRCRFGDRDDKSESNQLNQLHQSKRQTPVVGGIAMLLGSLTASLLFADLTSSHTWVLLTTLVTLAGLGFADDWAKTFGTNRKAGLSPRQKLAAQLVLGLGVGLFLLVQASGSGDATRSTLAVPFTGVELWIGGAGFVLLSAFLVTGSSNAVNLTDGLDGLAGGCSLVAFGVYLTLAALATDPASAQAFGLSFVAGAGETTVVLAAMAGALTGFLCYNRHPAQVFMGDTGSLPLGGVLAAAAILTRQELLLALVGGVFVAEALSVMAQVGSFKLTGKRVLRCAPLHHHFEFKGWRETEIVTGFHGVALLLGILGLAGLGLTS